MKPALWLFCLLVPGTTLPLAAQPRGDKALPRILLGEMREASHRLQAADQLAAQKQWMEALDEYQRLVEDFPDDLAAESTPGEAVLSPRRVVQVRRLVQLRLTRLPSAVLEKYRQRTDARTKRWLDQGQVDRDPVPL